jgi:hypothetical protein
MIDTMKNLMVCVEAALPHTRWGEDGERELESAVVLYAFHREYGDAYDAIYTEASVGAYVVGIWYQVEWRKEAQPPEPRSDRRIFVAAEECK